MSPKSASRDTSLLRSRRCGRTAAAPSPPGARNRRRACVRVGFMGARKSVCGGRAGGSGRGRRATGRRTRRACNLRWIGRGSRAWGPYIGRTRGWRGRRVPPSLLYSHAHKRYRRRRSTARHAARVRRRSASCPRPPPAAAPTSRAARRWGRPQSCSCTSSTRPRHRPRRPRRPARAAPVPPADRTASAPRRLSPTPRRSRSPGC
ncbi:MAG: hypothetical protein J3K34DRAFT_435062 [Monoraphidium minutum]|nr:MAG: hypothetical protein J3K34DRAFT_435062 [Monoraphidium minutum]